MAKRKISTVTTRREEQERDDNPIPKLIKSYLIDGEEFNDELRNLQYKIQVQKFNRDGRAILVQGRVYDNLEDLPFQLGSRFGTSRFRLFITATNGEGERVAFVKMEDFPIEWDGGDGEPEESDEPDELSDGQLQIQLEQLRHQHAKELKQMEMNKEMFVAAMNAKGSGGALKVSDMLQLLQTGIALGSGRELPAEIEPETGGLSDIMSVLNSPIAQALAKNLLTPKQEPVQPAPAPKPSGDPARMPDIPELEH